MRWNPVPEPPEAQGRVLVNVTYAGPGLAGKTTNTRFVHAATRPADRVRLESVKHHDGRYLIYDFIPASLPRVGGREVILRLLSAGGALFSAPIRADLVAAAHAIVVVIDSQAEREPANPFSLAEVWQRLHERGIDPGSVPIILQYNKRDLPNVVPLEVLREQLNPHGRFPEFEAAAASTDGPGVFPTLKAAVKAALFTERVRVEAERFIRLQSVSELRAALEPRPTLVTTAAVLTGWPGGVRCALDVLQEKGADLESRELHDQLRFVRGPYRFRALEALDVLASAIPPNLLGPG